MASVDHRPIDVTIKSDHDIKSLKVDQSQLNDVMVDSQSRNGIVEIATLRPGLRLYAFTFES